MNPTHPELQRLRCADLGRTTTHQMAWWQWGDPHAAHAVVCVHGLSRQGRDFDVLARALLVRATQPLRIICPDVAGRGESDWLSDPRNYQVPQYAADLLALLAALHAQAPLRSLDWVGTSMGGLIGMAVAGQTAVPLPAPVRRLVLNDVGPVVQWRAIERIAAYLGQPQRFASVEAAADALWAISSTFGPHTREQWLALCRPLLRPAPEGGLRFHYDPAIALPLRGLTPQAAAAGEAAMWALYDAISARTLLLRGAVSDLLSPETALAMTQRGPQARCVEFAGIGHAPTLVADDQVEVVCRFLLEPEA